jgi:hypothetical protein
VHEETVPEIDLKILRRLSIKKEEGLQEGAPPPGMGPVAWVRKLPVSQARESSLIPSVPPVRDGRTDGQVRGTGRMECSNAISGKG